MKDQKRVVPCAMLCEGEYGLKDVIVGVPVRLGRGGGESIVEYDLTAEERGALQASSDAVRDLCGVVDRLLTDRRCNDWWEACQAQQRSSQPAQQRTWLAVNRYSWGTLKFFRRIAYQTLGAGVALSVGFDAVYRMTGVGAGEADWLVWSAGSTFWRITGSQMVRIL